MLCWVVQQPERTWVLASGFAHSLRLKPSRFYPTYASLMLTTNSSSTGPALRSQVVTEPLGPLVVGSVLVGVGLLALPVGLSLWPYGRASGGLAILLGVLALALAWRLATRSSYPMLLTLRAEDLYLTALGHDARQGASAETIPLASIVAYKHWLSRGRVFARYYLRLELAGGRVLRIADPPGVLPNDPMGTVLLSQLVEALARRVGPDTTVRLLFSQTPTARILGQFSWLAVLASAALLWNGYLTTGVLLLAVAGVYLLSYYRAQRLADKRLADIGSPNQL